MLYDFPRDQRQAVMLLIHTHLSYRLNGILLICSFVFIAACGYPKRGIGYDSCARLPHGASKLLGVSLIRFSCSDRNNDDLLSYRPYMAWLHRVRMRFGELQLANSIGAPQRLQGRGETKENITGQPKQITQVTQPKSG